MSIYTSNYHFLRDLCPYSGVSYFVSVLPSAYDTYCTGIRVVTSVANFSLSTPSSSAIKQFYDKHR